MGAGVSTRQMAPCAARPIGSRQPEQAAVLAAANAPRFASLSPHQIVPALADEGCYLASESTFYRLLRDADQLTRRGRTKAPARLRPQPLVATGANQVWSWDITYLASTVQGLFFYLYLIMDVYSRKIVGWEVYPQESAAHAASVFQKAHLREGVRAGALVLHSDNGSPMKGATMLVMLQRLGVMPSFSRPAVSNDNPYSESLFSTAKGRPDFPYRAVRLRRGSTPLGRAVRRLVQPRAPAQRAEVRHPGTTPSRRGCRLAGAARGALPSRSGTLTRARWSGPDPRLDIARFGLAQPGETPSRQGQLRHRSDVIDATTTLTLTGVGSLNYVDVESRANWAGSQFWKQHQGRDAVTCRARIPFPRTISRVRHDRTWRDSHWPAALAGQVTGLAVSRRDRNAGRRPDADAFPGLDV